MVGNSPVTLELVRDQWTHHQRFLSYGGAIAEQACDGFFGMPQGDPFSPWALAAIMSPAAYRFHHLNSFAAMILYVDDRNIRAKTWALLMQAVEYWNDFQELTGLRNNISKMQGAGEH